MTDDKAVFDVLRVLTVGLTGWANDLPLSDEETRCLSQAQRMLDSRGRSQELSRQTRQLFQLLDQWADGKVKDATLREAVLRRRALRDASWAEKEGESDAGLAGRRRDNGDTGAGASALRDDATPEDGAELPARDSGVQERGEGD